MGRQEGCGGGVSGDNSYNKEARQYKWLSLEWLGHPHVFTMASILLQGLDRYVLTVGAISVPHCHIRTLH